MMSWRSLESSFFFAVSFSLMSLLELFFFPFLYYLSLNLARGEGWAPHENSLGLNSLVLCKNGQCKSWLLKYLNDLVCSFILTAGQSFLRSNRNLCCIVKNKSIKQMWYVVFSPMEDGKQYYCCICLGLFLIFFCCRLYTLDSATFAFVCVVFFGGELPPLWLGLFWCFDVLDYDGSVSVSCQWHM